MTVPSNLFTGRITGSVAGAEFDSYMEFNSCLSGFTRLRLSFVVHCHGHSHAFFSVRAVVSFVVRVCSGVQVCSGDLRLEQFCVACFDARLG
ncbi:hypothetical protein ACSQ67_019845 [Phaseolus vulgaris]